MSVQGEVKFEKFGQALRREIHKEFLALAFEMEGKLSENAPVGWTHGLGGSFGHKIDFDGDGIGLQVGSLLQDFQYAQYVEFGTRPHLPPYEPIYKWVEMKIQPHVLAVSITFEDRRFPGKAMPVGRGSKTVEGKKIKKVGQKILTGSAREKEINRIVYFVRKGIKLRGTKGQFFMRKTLRELGLEFELTFTNNDGGIYSVNAGKWLENRAETIIQRAAAGLT